MRINHSSHNRFCRITAAVLNGQRFRETMVTIPGFNHWAPDALTVDNCSIGWPPGFMLDVAGDLLLTHGAALYLFAAPVDDPVGNAGAIHLLAVWYQLALDDAEQRIVTRSTRGLIFHYPSRHFAGTVTAASLTSDPAYEGDPGTLGFYTIRGTVVAIR